MSNDKQETGTPNEAPASLGLAEGSAAFEIADRIISALEGNFREWIGPDEYAHAKPMLAAIIDRELGADSRRLDWLADRENGIGQVLLPRQIVERNLHSMRAAIDAAMRLPNTEAREPEPSGSARNGSTQSGSL